MNFQMVSVCERVYIIVEGQIVFEQEPLSSTVQDKTAAFGSKDTWLCETALWAHWVHTGRVEAMSEVYLVSLIMDTATGTVLTTVIGLVFVFTLKLVWFSVEGLHNYRSFLADLAQLLESSVLPCTKGLLGLNVTAVCWYARAEEFVGMSKLCCVLPNLFHPASSA